ncbi:TolC family outer membrane protein [Pseudomonas fluorescens]|uniref:TolC family outer membrane protein n=1 Tax=Pseudomonas fluorescens TaxID=294 RepID=UPI00398FA619
MMKIIGLAVLLAMFPSSLQADVNAGRANLLSVYEEALVSDVQLLAARHHFESLKEKVPQARAGLLPTLNSSVRSAAVTQTGSSSSRSRNDSTLQANLIQPLFRADRWFQLDATQATLTKDQFELLAKEQFLILTVAQAYFETLRALDRVAASRAEETALQRQQQQAQGRLARGAASITDLLDAKAAYDNASANRKLAERKVDDAFGDLSRLTNRHYSAIEGLQHRLPIVAPAPGQADAWVNQAVQQNLNLQASQFSVVAAEHTLRQRKAGFAPTLDAVVSYRKGNSEVTGGANYRDDITQRSIALELNIPLYSGGMVRSQVREATEQLTRSQYEKEDRLRETVLATRNLHRTVNSDIEQVIARRQSIQSSRASVQANQVGWEMGSRNFADVLNAQRQLYNVVREYNNARYDYIINTLKLKQAAGLLSPADLISLSSYLSGNYDFEQDFLPPDSSAQT